MKRRSAIAAALVLLAATVAAHAQEPAASHRYAVLSLIGDTLNVVAYQMATGSSVDRNRRESIPVSDETFDRAALRAVNEALKRIDARSAPALLAVSAPSLFKEQGRFFEGARLVLPEQLMAAVKGTGATRLLLLTKHRDEADLRATNDENLGTGMLDGIGFYLDTVMPMTYTDTGESGRGFIAPFVYVRISLIDIATARLIAQKIVKSSKLHVAGRRREAIDPWDVLTPSEKVDTLRSMIEEEIARAVPALAATP